MKRLFVGLLTLSVLLVLLAVVGFVAAIWITGPDSARTAGTSAIALLVGSVLGWLGTEGLANWEIHK